MFHKKIDFLTRSQYAKQVIQEMAATYKISTMRAFLVAGENTNLLYHHQVRETDPKIAAQRLALMNDIRYVPGFLRQSEEGWCTLMPVNRILNSPQAAEYADEIRSLPQFKIADYPETVVLKSQVSAFAKEKMRALECEVVTLLIPADHVEVIF